MRWTVCDDVRIQDNRSVDFRLLWTRLNPCILDSLTDCICINDWLWVKILFISIQFLSPRKYRTNKKLRKINTCKKFEELSLNPDCNVTIRSEAIFKMLTPFLEILVYYEIPSSTLAKNLSKENVINLRNNKVIYQKIIFLH